jgi:hypothetical protein
MTIMFELDTQTHDLRWISLLDYERLFRKYDVNINSTISEDLATPL